MLQTAVFSLGVPFLLAFTMFYVGLKMRGREGKRQDKELDETFQNLRKSKARYDKLSENLEKQAQVHHDVVEALRAKRTEYHDALEKSNEEYQAFKRESENQKRHHDQIGFILSELAKPGVSQRQLARKIGIQQASISKRLKGENEPSKTSRSLIEAYRAKQCIDSIVIINSKKLGG